MSSQRPASVRERFAAGFVRPTVLAALAVLPPLACAACGSGLRVVEVQSSVEKPANVMVLYTVVAVDGAVSSLGAGDFALYEDDRPVPAADFRIVKPDLTGASYAAVLIDWSAGVAGTPEGAALIDSTSSFVARLAFGPRVGVFAYEGSATLHPVIPFGSSDAALTKGFEPWRALRPTDTSTDLFGAVGSGLAQLERAMATSTQPLRLGTLVVVARGPDRAARITREELSASLRKPEHAAIARAVIGLGPNARGAGLESIATSSVDWAGSTSDLDAALGRVTAQIERRAKGHYFVSYCSPARSGEHKLKIEARRKVTGDDGKEHEERGSVLHSFRADGFTGGCTPKVPADVEAMTK